MDFGEESRWKLAAAHLNRLDSRRSGIRKHIRRIVSHPSYDKESYDVAVLLVSSPFRFNDYVRPACLPPLAWGKKFNGGKMIASGTGRSEGRQETLRPLKFATIPMNSKQQCKHLFSSARGLFSRSYKGKSSVVMSHV